LSTALRVLGIRHEFVLASPRFTPKGLAFRRVADFDNPVIKLGDGRWIFPGPDHGAIGYLPYPLLGGHGIVLWPPQEDLELVRLPEMRRVSDARHVEMKAHINRRGVLEGRVIDTLIGGESISIGRYFSRLEKSEHPRLAERLLMGAVASGRITSMRSVGTQERSDRLTLKYRFNGTLDSPNRIGCFPIQPGRKFAGLESRKSPLLLSLPVDQSVTIRLTADPKLVLDTRNVDLRYGAHSFQRRIERAWNEIIIKCRLRVVGGHIQPADYPRFRDWARAVDRSEYVRISHDAKMGAPIGSGSLPNFP